MNSSMQHALLAEEMDTPHTLLTTQPAQPLLLGDASRLHDGVLDIPTSTFMRVLTDPFSPTHTHTSTHQDAHTPSPSGGTLNT